MPIVLLILLAAFGLGWLDRSDSSEDPVDLVETDVDVDVDVDVDDVDAPDEPEPTWQQQCRARFEEARVQAATAAGFSAFSTGTVTTDDNPGGAGGVSYDLTLPGPDGTVVRYSAGISGVQPGNERDAEWYSLNGAIEPRDRFSFWMDEDGHSGFVAGADASGHAERQRAFKLVFQRAIDDCLDYDE